MYMRGLSDFTTSYVSDVGPNDAIAVPLYDAAGNYAVMTELPAQTGAPTGATPVIIPTNGTVGITAPTYAQPSAYPSFPASSPTVYNPFTGAPVTGAPNIFGIPLTTFMIGIALLVGVGMLVNNNTPYRAPRRRVRK